MRIYKEIQPDTKLKEFIKRYWILDIEEPTAAEMVNRVIPEGLFEIVINYKSPYYDITQKKVKLPNCFATGPLTSHRIFETNGSIGIFAIDFTFLGWHILARYAGHEFVNAAYKLEFLRQEIKNLSKMLLHAKNNKERLRTCNSFFMKTYGNASSLAFPIQDIVKYINFHKGNVTLDSLPGIFNCSQSKFERNFKQITGLSPKKYASMVRFRYALNFGQVHKNWADFVFDLGYYDQAHFIKEFKGYMGVTPYQYFKSKKQQNLAKPDKRSIVKTNENDLLWVA